MLLGGIWSKAAEAEQCVLGGGGSDCGGGGRGGVMRPSRYATEQVTLAVEREQDVMTSDRS